MSGYARDIEAAWGISGFAVRVGVNSGPAAVGLVGSADPQAVALGDATNVAARLQAAAEPGTILVGHVTARRLEHRFDLGPPVEVSVKGREEPVRAARLFGAKEREPRASTTPVVGRERELDVLRGVLGDLASGRGRVVLLTGAPGIGKTRLLTELAVEGADSVTWLEGRCHSYGGLPGWPFVEILLGWLGAEIGEPEIAIRTKARASLGALFGEDADAVLGPLAGLLRLRLDTPPATEDDTDQAFVRLLERLAASKPVIVAVEDTQWADAPTRRLAEHVLELTDRAPVGLVLTEEPIPGSHGAALRSHALANFGHRTSELALGPLTDAAAEQVLAGIVGDGIDPATRTGLIREAEGNPLYLEELARAFLEGALEPRGRTWTVTIGSLELLPPSLENLLVARIDRQADEPRRLAQIAAAIGRTFPVPVLERVAGESVREPLTSLLRAEIVREVGRYPELECTFTHGLLREAALSTLTSTRKRALYARDRVGVRVDLCRLARGAPRAARPLPRAGGEPAEGARVRGARPRRVRLALEPPVLCVHERIEGVGRSSGPSTRRPPALRLLVERITGTSFASRRRLGSGHAPAVGVEYPVGLIEVPRDQSLAVAGEVLDPPQPKIVVRVGSGARIPGEERNVERAARENLVEDDRRRAKIGMTSTRQAEVAPGRARPPAPLPRDAGALTKRSESRSPAHDVDAVGTAAAAGLLEQPTATPPGGSDTLLQFGR